MELRHLRYFVSVVAHGNFSKAAETLRLTQPALSRQIKNLEAEIGLPFFVRKPNALSLTREGEIFYEEAQEVLARADEAIRRVRKRPRMEVLRVGYVHSLTASVMPRVVEKFQSGNKNVRLELLDLTTYDMSQKAAAGQIDMAILPKSMGHHFKGFQWVELQSLAPVLVASGKNPLAKLKKIPPEKLRNKQLYGLGPEKYPEYVPRLRDILKPFGVKPRLASQAADDIAALFIALEANTDIAVLTEGVTKMLPSTLVTRRFSPELAPLIVAAGLPATQSNPHAEVFVKLLINEINKPSEVKLRFGKPRRTMPEKILA